MWYNISMHTDAHKNGKPAITKNGTVSKTGARGAGSTLSYRRCYNKDCARTFWGKTAYCAACRGEDSDRSNSVGASDIYTENVPLEEDTEPTQYLPGTRQKVAVMVSRASRGKSLFNPKDATFEEWAELAAGILAKDGCGDGETGDF